MNQELAAMNHSSIFLFFIFFSSSALFSNNSGSSKDDPLVPLATGTAFLSVLYASVFTRRLNPHYDNRGSTHNASAKHSTGCLQAGILAARLGTVAFGTLGFFSGAFSFCSDYSQEVSLSTISSLAYTNAALCLALNKRLTNVYHQKECSHHTASNAKR
jgi:hypothetical protein